MSSLDVLCPSCGDTGVAVIGKLPDSHWFAGKFLEQPLVGGNLYRCHHCQLKFRHPMHDAATYERLYDNAAISTWPSATSRLDWNLITDLVLEHLPQGGRVLDFGCYNGGLLAQLAPPYERYGVEINHAAANVASKRADARVWSTIDDIPPGLRFDAIITTDVIEHMANPLYFIDKLAALLTNRGILIITTGDADNALWNRFGANWWYCFYHEHVTFLSKAWFNFLAPTKGLSILRYQLFHYCRRTAVRRAIDAIFTYFYGFFPTVYLLLANALQKLRDRSSVANVPGNGVTADHFLIVLARKIEP